MKITVGELRQIIREEIQKVKSVAINEAFNPAAAKKAYDKLDVLAKKFGFKASRYGFDGEAAPGNNIGRWDDSVWGNSSYANLYRDERGNLFVGFSNIGDKSRKETYSGKDRAEKWFTASKWNEEFGTLEQRKKSKK